VGEDAGRAEGVEGFLLESDVSNSLQRISDEMRHTATTASRTLASWTLSLYPEAETLFLSELKKATSKFSLKVMAWNVARLLSVRLGGGGWFGTGPLAICWMSSSCSGLGSGKPLGPGPGAGPGPGWGLYFMPRAALKRGMAVARPERALAMRRAWARDRIVAGVCVSEADVVRMFVRDKYGCRCEGRDCVSYRAGLSSRADVDRANPS
jgi:hypothetical protein